MCANCMSNAEFVAANAVLAGALMARPARSALVALGVLPEPHPLAREMRAVRFLRDLELDPVEILGAGTVAAADRAAQWEPAPVYRRAGRRGAIRSQRRPATQ